MYFDRCILALSLVIFGKFINDLYALAMSSVGFGAAHDQGHPFTDGRHPFTDGHPFTDTPLLVAYDVQSMTRHHSIYSPLMR